MIKKLRQSLNESTRYHANKLTPRLGDKGLGLGDFLTGDINFRRAGATAGALTPLIGIYGMLSSTDGPVSGAIMAPLVYAAAYPITLSLSYILGVGAHRAGEHIDAFLGDEDAQENIVIRRAMADSRRFEGELEEIN